MPKRAKKKSLSTSQAIGAAGELAVQAALIRRGWLAANVNVGGMRNAPSVDIVAMKGRRDVRLAVKSCNPSACSQWSVKAGWRSLFKGTVKPHFLVFVWFVDDNHPDDRRIFIVPAELADREIRRVHRLWHRLHGKDPDASRHVAIWWRGKNHNKDYSKEFAKKWARYENAWHSLEVATK